MEQGRRSVVYFFFKKINVYIIKVQSNRPNQQNQNINNNYYCKTQNFLQKKTSLC